MNVVNNIFRRLVKWPKRRDMEVVVFEFKELCHLPSMHGAIDGTHGLGFKCFW